MNLWERTKSVAKLYTGTFILVMFLNQLVFFGFCLNPICLVAAMPHVLLITVALGSWINKQFGWGDDKQSGNVGTIYKESKKLVDNTFAQTALDLKRANEQTRKEQFHHAEFDRPNPKYLELSKIEDPKDYIDYSTCKTCGARTILRTAKVGTYAGKDFYGCSRYPKCKGITNIESI